MRLYVKSTVSCKNKKKRRNHASLRVSINVVSYTFARYKPRCFESAMVASRPFLLIVLMADVATLSLIHSPVDSMKKRFVWRLGKNFRFVLLFACDTLLPVRVRFPVN